MTPEQAAEARALALRNAMLGLQQLPSHELGPDGTRAAGILYDLQRRIAAIEMAEAGPPPAPPKTEDARVEELMAEMAARGLNRV